MKFFSSLLVLSLALGTFGALVLERSKYSAKDKCPSAQEVAYRTLNVDGHEIVHQTFSCPNGNLANTSPPATSVNTIRSSMLEKRNAAECRTPAPECQCGTSFVCGCQNVTATAPNVNDCTTLISALSVVAQTEGATFVVQSDNFEIVTFKTCGLEFTNFANNPLEYCWDELASTAGVVNQLCFQQKAGTAAACDSNNGLWLTQALRVGS